MNDLVEKYAPHLKMDGPAAEALARRATPGVQGGLAEPRYDETGMPLPYLEQGGVREYFGNEAPEALRGTMSGPSNPLRGLSQPSAGLYDSPITPEETAPQGGTSFGRRAVLPIPQDPSQSGYVPPAWGYQPMQREEAGLQTQPQDMLRRVPGTRRGEREYNGPRARAGIPPSHRIEDPRITETETNQMRANVSRSGPDGLDPAGPVNMTLRDLFEAMRIPINVPQLRGRLGADDLRGRSNVLGNPEVDDGRVSRTGRVTRTSQGAVDLPDFSTEEGLVDFNNRMGLRLNRQVRTQAEQDSLYNRGLTPTRNSAHITGNAFDWPATQLPNGLTGRAAEDYARTRFAQVYGEDAAAMYDFQWETGRGRHQGSGPHVHAERN